MSDKGLDSCLETWRKKIRIIDEEIIVKAALRMQLARKIGLHKIEQELPIKDDTIEQKNLAHARALAEAQGLDPIFAEGLITLIMNESKRIQTSLVQPKA